MGVDKFQGFEVNARISGRRRIDREGRSAGEEYRAAETTPALSVVADVYLAAGRAICNGTRKLIEW
jgi:hypothetical protein